MRAEEHLPGDSIQVMAASTLIQNILKELDFSFLTFLVSSQVCQMILNFVLLCVCVGMSPPHSRPPNVNNLYS